MNIMPISDLPMPADDRSQLQVLGERKAELNEQAQSVRESKMPRQQKEQALDEIDSKAAAVRVEIRHKQASQQADKISDDKRIREKSDKNKQLEENRLQKMDEKAAMARQGTERRKLDIRV